MPSSAFDAKQETGRGTEESRGQKRSPSGSDHLAAGECDKCVTQGHSHSTGSLNKDPTGPLSMRKFPVASPTTVKWQVYVLLEPTLSFTLSFILFINHHFPVISQRMKQTWSMHPSWDFGQMKRVSECRVINCPNHQSGYHYCSSSTQEERGLECKVSLHMCFVSMFNS